VGSLRAFPLAPADVFLLSRLDGVLTLEEVADVSPCDAEETRERLLGLVELGLVEVVEGQASDLRRAAMGPSPAPRVPTRSGTRPTPARTVPPPSDFDVDAMFEGEPAEPSPADRLERVTVPFAQPAKRR
jgi:hypothetical protein